jgi:hypothetical protein
LVSCKRLCCEESPHRPTAYSSTPSPASSHKAERRPGRSRFAICGNQLAGEGGGTGDTPAAAAPTSSRPRSLPQKRGYTPVRGQVHSYALRAESIRFCPEGVGVSSLTIWREAAARTVDAGCLTVDQRWVKGSWLPHSGTTQYQPPPRRLIHRNRAAWLLAGGSLLATAVYQANIGRLIEPRREQAPSHRSGVHSATPSPANWHPRSVGARLPATWPVQPLHLYRLMAGNRGHSCHV